MTEDSFNYDVAISFLNADLGLAQELRDRLGQSLDVFVYSEKQEELAGTDGLESFRSVYRTHSRLVVILQRAGWGETPWTRVEKQAITDRFLAEGPGFLFIIMLDEAPLPPWVPETLIRFSLEDFGVEQAAGAIKARALDRGSLIHRPTIAQLAQTAQEAASFASERSRIVRSYEGVAEAERSAAQVIELVSTRVTEMQSAAPDLGIEYGVANGVVGVRTEHVAVQVTYQNRIVNALDEARLVLREFSGPLILPGQNAYYLREPRELAEAVYLPDLTRALGWCWVDSSGHSYASEQVADHCVERFLALIHRQANGSLPSPW